MASNTYDIVIIGAGIAGLYTGVELLRANPKLRIAIADKYKFLGGRTFTFNADISGQHYMWEEGAARIANTHLLVLNLLKRYGLTTVPIEGDVEFRVPGRPAQPDLWSASLPVLLKPFASLSRNVLGQTTLMKLLEETHGRSAARNIALRYPYRAELHTLRADLALDVFLHEFKSFEGFVSVKEGFSELIERMRKDFLNRGGTLLEQHECVGLSGEAVRMLKGPPSQGSTREELVIPAPTLALVLAIPSAALARLTIARRLTPWLSHLRMMPLLRIYAAFPAGSALDSLPKFITPLDNRFVIPNGPTVCQISYTDSEDAEALLKRKEIEGEYALGKALTRSLGASVGKEFPDPLFVKFHSWPEGTTYWLPGAYDPAAMSRVAAHPLPKEFPKLFVTGESYSMRQCWVQGALEHAATVVAMIQKRF